MKDQRSNRCTIREVSSASINASLESCPACPKGWALKDTKKSSRFSANQKEYLSDRFREGEANKSAKADANLVAKQMRYAKGLDGTRLFQMDEFLTSQQISGYFSRLASKRTLAVDDENDLKAAEIENRHEIILSEIRTTMGPTTINHPVICCCTNLCELNQIGKLQITKLQLLKSYCDSLGIKVSLSEDKRQKRTYFEKLKHFLENCSCQV